MQFTTSNTAASVGGVKMLCYAPSGIGKTVLCATAPAPIILSAESGLLSLKKSNLERVFGVNAPGICYDIPVITIESVQDLKDAFTIVTGPKGAQFQTICMDSITEIAEQVLANAKVGVKDMRQAYGALIDQMIGIVKSYRDIANKNVYMTAKMETAKDELSGAMVYGPMMPGSKVGQQLPYLFDEVFRLGVMEDAQKKKHRFLQTQPDMQYGAKDRSGALAAIEYPNLTVIINKILAG